MDDDALSLASSEEEYTQPIGLAEIQPIGLAEMTRGLSNQQPIGLEVSEGMFRPEAWHLDDVCKGEKHTDCLPLNKSDVASLVPGCPRLSNPEQAIPVASLFQLIVACWALLYGAPEEDEILDKFVSELCNAHPERVLQLYRGTRIGQVKRIAKRRSSRRFTERDMVTSGSGPRIWGLWDKLKWTTAELRKVIDLWAQKCSVARGQLALHPWACTNVTVGEQMEPEIRELSAQLSMAITEHRLKYNFKNPPRHVHSNVLFVGDELATQLGLSFGQSMIFNLVGPISRMADEFKERIFLGHEVIAVVIWFASERSSDMEQAWTEMADLLHTRSVPTVIIMSPYSTSVSWPTSKKAFLRLKEKGKRISDSRVEFFIPTCAREEVARTRVNDGKPTKEEISEIVHNLEKMGVINQPRSGLSKYSRRQQKAMLEMMTVPMETGEPGPSTSVQVAPTPVKVRSIVIVPPFPRGAPPPPEPHGELPVMSSPPRCTRLERADGSGYLGFFGRQYYFSNHHRAEFEEGGRRFTSSEQCYMFKKLTFFRYDNLAQEILRMEDPAEIKAAAHARNMAKVLEHGMEPRGREFSAREWERVKLKAMEEALLAKFGQNEHLRAELLSTEDFIAEMSLDTYWGTGPASDARPNEYRGRLMENRRYCAHPEKWTGRNELGWLLMKVREQLSVSNPEFPVVPIGKAQGGGGPQTGSMADCESVFQMALSSIRQKSEKYPTEFGQFAIDMEDFYQGNVQSLPAYNRKMRWGRLLEKALSTYGSVQYFGSVVTPLALDTSDLDVVVLPVTKRLKDTDVPAEYQTEMLEIFRKVLQRTEFGRWIKYVTKSGFPKLGMEQRDGDMTIDVTYGNTVGLKNARLVNALCRMDHRFTLIAFLVKGWAKAKGIGDAQKHGLNSWSWTLLVIFYCQVGVTPPIFPALEEFNQEEALSGPDPENTEMSNKQQLELAKMAIGFFSFVGNIRWTQYMISTRKGQWMEKQWGKLVEIEEPLKPERNTANSLTESDHLLKIMDAVDSTEDDLLSGEKVPELPSLGLTFKRSKRGPSRDFRILYPLLTLMSLVGSSRGIMVCDPEIQRNYYRVQDSVGEACHTNHFDGASSPLRIFRPNDEMISIPADLCRKVEQKIVYWKNLIGEMRSNQSMRVLPTTIEECRAMMRKKRCEFGTLSGGQTASTGLGFDPPIDPSYWSTKQSESRNCYHSSTTVFMNPWTGTIQSPIGGNEKCEFEEEMCQLESGELLIWRQRDSRNTRKWVEIGNFNGSLVEGIWVREDHQLALSFARRPEYFRDKDEALVMSDQHYAVSQETFERLMELQNDKEKGWPTGRRRKRNLSGSGIVRSEQLGAVLTVASALEAKKHRAMLYNLLCGRSQSSHQSGEATVVARKLLNNPLLQARWIGDKNLLEVWSCVPVDSYNFIALRGNEVCYHRIPVNISLGGRILSGFLDPHDLVVTEKSKEGPCIVYGKQTVEIDGKILSVDQLTGRTEQIVPGRLLSLKAGARNVHVPVLKADIFKNLVITKDTSGAQLIGLLKSFRVAQRFRSEESRNVEGSEHSWVNAPIGSAEFSLFAQIDWEKFLIRFWMLFTAGWILRTSLLPWLVRLGLRQLQQRAIVDNMQPLPYLKSGVSQPTEELDVDEERLQRMESRRMANRRAQRARSAPGTRARVMETKMKETGM